MGAFKPPSTPDMANIPNKNGFPGYFKFYRFAQVEEESFRNPMKGQ